jgi:hypothetical protein
MGSHAWPALQHCAAAPEPQMLAIGHEPPLMHWLPTGLHTPLHAFSTGQHWPLRHTKPWLLS